MMNSFLKIFRQAPNLCYNLSSILNLHQSAFIVPSFFPNGIHSGQGGDFPAGIRQLA